MESKEVVMKSLFKETKSYLFLILFLCLLFSSFNNNIAFATDQEKFDNEKETVITTYQGKECVDGEVLVSFSSNQPDTMIYNALNSLESTIQASSPDESLLVTSVPEGETMEDFISELEALSNVEYVQPNYFYRLHKTVNDPGAQTPDPAQWHLNTIDAYEAWDISMGSADVIVAVLDTGVDLDHPDLAGQIYMHTDTVDNDENANDDDGHGTHVSGIIAAATNNGLGVAGIAPDVKLIVADIFGWYTVETNPGVYEDVFGALTSEIIEGIEYATENGADVINMSIGGYYYDLAYETAINDAVDAGTVVVASAGNDGKDEYDETQGVSTKCYPADFDSCISVIWTNEDDTRNPNSNYGPSKDIAAPGNAILSTYWKNDDEDWQYALLSGTSMAAPVVTGVAALMLSVNPDLTVEQVKNILYSTALELGDPGRDDEYGHGRVNAHAAVQAAAKSIYTQGDGTIDNPFGISTPKQLNGVRYLPDSHFVLLNDIDMSTATGEGGEYYNGGAGWELIPKLSGSLDGQWFSIEGLFSYGEVLSDKIIGFIQTLDENAVIKNIYISDFVFQGNLSPTALIHYNYGSIQGCDFSGTYTDTGESYNSSSGTLGGITAINYGTISNCNFSGDLLWDEPKYRGGIATENHGVISQCSLEGSIISGDSDDAAGLVYKNYETGIIERCSNQATVQGGEAAGIAYYNYGSINECYNTGDVFGENASAGISRYNQGTLENCFNTGNISAYRNSKYANGIAMTGSDAVVNNCYNIGLVAGELTVNNGTNIYTIEALPLEIPDGVTSPPIMLTHEEFMQQSSFLGFDFDTVWTMDGNADFPYPELRNVEYTPPSVNETDFLGGNGTPYNPFIITEPEHLYNLRNHKWCYAKLNSDIDVFSVTSEDGVFYNEGQGWKPESFSGVLDGNGYRIIGLNSSQGGLFSTLGDPSIVFDLGVVDANCEEGIISKVVTGWIKRCYTTGYTSGGGVCSFSRHGLINDCFSTANVTSGSGLASESLEMCYTLEQNLSSGSSNGNCYRMELPNPIFSDLYYIEDFINLSEEEFRMQSSFEGFDFENVWTMGGNPDYPYPELQTVAYIEKGEDTENFDGGNGLPHNPYRITSEQHLNNVRDYNGDCFILSSDIDLSDDTSEGGVFYNDGGGWSPFAFKGVFNGNGHNVSGINIKSGSDNVGLFSYITGNVFDLDVTDFNIEGDWSVGGLAGSVYGAIENCTVEGKVHGNKAVGLLAGEVRGSSDTDYVFVIGCNSAGTSISNDKVGGLIGIATDNCKIDSCSSSANVFGDEYVGGLFGMFYVNESYDAELSNCFTNGSVFGETSSAGFAGYSRFIGKDALNCYWLDGNEDVPVTGTTLITVNEIQFPQLDTLEINQHIDESDITTNMVLSSEVQSIELISTANGRIARIDNGEVIGVALGKTSLKIKLNYLSGSYYIDYIIDVTGEPSTVVPVEGLLLDDSNVELYLYQTTSIKANILPELATNRNIIWTSDDDSIASVDGLGNVTAHKKGDTIITATTEDGSFSEHCSVTVSIEGPKVDGVSITSGSAYCWPGDVCMYSAKVTPASAVNKTIKWSSSDENIATIGETTGMVQAISPGTATITVTTEDGGFTDTAFVYVKQPVTGVEVIPESIIIDVGEVFASLEVNVLPANAFNKDFYYYSNNSSVAWIDLNGVITGKSVGSAEIIVTTEDGGYTAKCIVNVTQPVTSVSLNQSNLNINVGSTAQLLCTVEPEDASNKSVVWSSSNEDVATVIDGNVTTHSVGETIIKVTTNDGGLTAACTVNVVQKVTGVELIKTELLMAEGESDTLSVSIFPSDATNKLVTWASSNTNVATVTDGTVSSVDEGTSVITVTTEDGDFTDSCTVTVKSAKIESSVYSIDRQNEYLKGVDIASSVSTLKSNLENDVDDIKVYDSTGNEYTGALLRTGMTVRLVINGTEHDELKIVVLGDSNGDGYISIIDYTLVRLDILELKALAGEFKEASDVNEDGVTSITDYTLIRLDILGLKKIH